MPSTRSTWSGITRTAMLALSLWSIPALCGSRPQVDLSVSVSVTPAQFVPGGTAIVTMTVYNAGPDTAGDVLQGEPYIVVYEKPYNIVGRPPPFTLPEPSVGCTAYVEESEYIPGLPGGGISLLFSYWFDAIPAGQSRTCTYRVQFLPSTTESFATNWLVSSAANDDDVDPNNNRFDYTFVTVPSAAPASVPTGSLWGWIVLGIGFFLISSQTLRRHRKP